MRIVFVHGWSVTHTNTYGVLPAAVAAFAPPSLDVTVQELLLARYVSFSDEVTVDDIARAMQHAIATEVLPNLQPGERFACVTHSTGGPVVRKWITLYHGEDLAACPLSHLVMLAPANHGSALAQLGKRRLSRLKSFVVDGVEPGAGVLDWLELGSQQAWDLNQVVNVGEDDELTLDIAFPSSTVEVTVVPLKVADKKVGGKPMSRQEATEAAGMTDEVRTLKLNDPQRHLFILLPKPRT